MPLPTSWDGAIRLLLEKRGVANMELLRLLTPHQIKVMRGMGVKTEVVVEYCKKEGTPLLEPPASLKQRMTEIFGSPQGVPTVYFYNCGILSKDQYGTLLRYDAYTLGELATKMRERPELWLAIATDWSPITRSKVKKLLSDVGL